MTRDLLPASVPPVEPEQRRPERPAPQRISRRPPQRQPGRGIDDEEHGRGQQEGDTIEYDERAEASYVRGQDPQGHPMHPVDVGRLPDHEHNDGPARHLAQTEPRVRRLHPGARHHHGDERQHLNCPRQTEQPCLKVLTMFVAHIHDESNLTPGITRCPGRLIYLTAFVSAVGCMPLLDGGALSETAAG